MKHREGKGRDRREWYVLNFWSIIEGISQNTHGYVVSNKLHFRVIVKHCQGSISWNTLWWKLDILCSWENRVCLYFYHSKWEWTPLCSVDMFGLKRYAKTFLFVEIFILVTLWVHKVTEIPCCGWFYSYLPMEGGNEIVTCEPACLPLCLWCFHVV